MVHVPILIVCIFYYPTIDSIFLLPTIVADFLVSSTTTLLIRYYLPLYNRYFTTFTLLQVKVPILAISLELYDDNTNSKNTQVKKVQWFDETSGVGKQAFVF